MFFAFRLLLQAVREPPPQHLVQGGKVVRALDRLDAEAAVFLFRGFTVDEHHHARDAQNTLRVGNVVALNAPWGLGQPQRLAERRRRADRALFADARAGVPLLQRVMGVFRRQQHQIVLLAAPGCDQRHRRALLLPQPLL